MHLLCLNTGDLSVLPMQAFVWFSQETASLSLNGISCLIPIKEISDILYEVGIEILGILN
jgi:hypothetical protein